MKTFLKGLELLFLLLCILALFIPIGHGASLGILLYYGLKKEILAYPEKREILKKERIAKDIVKEKKNRQFYKKLSDRFVGPLTVEVNYTKDNWQQGRVNGLNVWLDINTGIIWQNYQGFTLDSWGAEELKQAKQYCYNLSPKGYWSLPTNAEFALGIKSQMQTIFSDIKGRWIAQLHNQSFALSEGLPSIVGFQNQGLKMVSVRCVAITNKAPVHGYSRDDISNDVAMGLLTR